MEIFDRLWILLTRKTSNHLNRQFKAGGDGGAFIDLLDGGFEAQLVELGFGADLGEQGAADAVGFDERGRGGFAAGEVGACGALVLEGFQLL